MKYTCTIDINAPIDIVVSLWEDESSFKHWQDGFVRIDHLSGMKNAVGAKSKILLKDKFEIELIETILIADLPREKKALYEHKHMTNTQSSRFKSLADDHTRYTSEVEYTQFNGFMIKLMARLFPSKFKAQSQKWMNQFKVFVEGREV